MNNEKFIQICKNISQYEHIENGIGTLKEKTLHNILKIYFESNPLNHEIKVGRYICDIKKENEIIEIQTANFGTMRKKLDFFLNFSKVTVVYPIPKTKYISWIDNQTSEVSNKRKSPKTGSIFDCFKELYRIKFYLKNKNLNICLVLLDLDEYRLLNGYSEDKKKGSTRYERIPIEIIEEIYINNIQDYSVLIPEKLPETFTVLEFSKAAKITARNAGYALNILKYLGVVEHIDKKGNAFIYKRKIKGNLFI